MKKTEIIDKWLALVATFCQPAAPGDALEAMRPLAVGIDDFNIAAFCRQTAIDAATAERFGAVPNLAVLRKALAEKSRQNLAYSQRAGGLEAPLAIVDERPDDWTAESRAAAVKTLRETAAALRADRLKQGQTVEKPADVTLKGAPLAAARPRNSAENRRIA